jgi:hypothetical protein
VKLRLQRLFPEFAGLLHQHRQRTVRAALGNGGRALTLEFVPNEDRISPPEAAGFSMMTLAGTPSGDAYTFSELERMFSNAGFARSEIHALPPSIEQVVISHK